MFKSSFKSSILAVLLMTFAFASTAAPAAPLKLENLRTEYRTNPLGIAVEKPRLSWVLRSSDEKARNERQTAYQILVASTPEKLAAHEGDLWNSGKTKSDETIHIPYAGPPLKSGQRAWWKLKVWNGADEESAWSEPATWSAGLLEPDDWKAKWIGYDEPEVAADGVASASASTKKADPINFDKLSWVWTDEGEPAKKAPPGKRFFATRIALPQDQPIHKAVFLLTADDRFDALVNGKKAGAGGGHTRAYEHNVTEFLKPGDNFIAVEATNGGQAENPAGLIGRLFVWHSNDADPRVFDIDQTWKFATTKPAKWETAEADLTALKPVKTILAVGGEPWGNPHRRVLDLPPPPYLRKAFAGDKAVKRATLYATALGLYELHLNGKRVSDDVLSPGWTDYKKRVYYQTYDVTNRIKQGDNVIGAILGDGWHSGYFSFQGKRNLYGSEPRLRVQLDLELADGTRRSIVTDDTWKCAYGPEREGDLLMGAAYDARLERRVAAWSTPNFDDSSWKPAKVDEKVAERKIEPHPGEPVRRHEQFTAKSIKETSAGVYIIDLGQNLVGWTRLKIRGAKRGDKIVLRHAEMLNPDGSPYVTALRGARAEDSYVAKGDAEEKWEPKFTFHGFRYVEISGLSSRPSDDTVTGIAVHTAMPRTGHFESSDKNVNQLFHNIVWGQKGNYLEVPTDCPQRDERLGWTGDAQFFINTGAYNYDVSAFFTKWLVDLVQDAQHADGSFADVAPDLLGGHGNVAWGDAGIICPHAIWRVYGDTRVIEHHYPAMQKYIAFLEKTAKDHVRGQGAYGDWLNLGDKTNPELIGTAYFEHVTRLMAEMALAIGKEEDAKKYGALADKVREVFVKTFVTENGSLKDSGQTGYALAFTMGLLPADKLDKAATHFAAAIERKNNHLATGFIGTPRLLPALTRAGRPDLAYKLFLNDTYPSWLFQVTLGATTMWERWDGWTPDGGFQDPGMNSFNHYGFGSVGEWMFRTAAGIDTESGAGAAYKKIVFRPTPQPAAHPPTTNRSATHPSTTHPHASTAATRPGGGASTSFAPAAGNARSATGALNFINAKYDSIRGPIASGWQRDGDGTLTIKFIVPPNTTATAYLPSGDVSKVTESGKPVTQVEGVKFLWTEAEHAGQGAPAGHGGRAAYRLGSGTYEFQITP